ncbi:MAG: hypothetical protein ACK5IQ_01970 [Bacteroidales bacterium]
MKNQKKINNTAELNEEINRLRGELGLPAVDDNNVEVPPTEKKHDDSGWSSYLKGTLVSDLLKANAFGLSKVALKYSKSLMKNKKVRKGLALALLSAGAVLVIRSMFDKDDEHHDVVDE